MSGHTWWLFVVMTFVVSATPGPNMLLVMSHGARFGWRKAVMTMAGPSVLFNNATKSFRGRDCSAAAYLFAVTLTAYWSFALGQIILYFVKD